MRRPLLLLGLVLVVAAEAQAPPPWALAAEDLATQRLFRLHYDGPEGEGSFRLTLRLLAADRYRATAVDAVGRLVWSLSVEGEEGLWLDHRQERFCRFRGRLAPEVLALSPFGLPSLPALLLGRMPVAPAGTIEPPEEGKEDRLDYLDTEGRRWTALLSPEGGVASWTLWQEGEPVVWWSRQGEEALLSERRRAAQLRWREVLREAIAPELAPLTPPATFREGCETASDPAQVP
ncbi:MAG TPA: hypothetical protein VF017_02980 [Thermoanaerobaculia bacterium]|nr:hypothetical protein [Thermoanaerobaculia bacterium]